MFVYLFICLFICLFVLCIADVVAFMLMQSIIGCYRKYDEGLVPGKLSANTTIRNLANKMNTGAAEMFSAFNTCYRDTGLFGFYAQCDEVAVEHCVLDLMHGITSLSYSVRPFIIHLSLYLSVYLLFIHVVYLCLYLSVSLLFISVVYLCFYLSVSLLFINVVNLCLYLSIYLLFIFL